MVFSCSSCGRKYTKACGYRFFSYPKNPSLKIEWLKACGFDLHPKNDTSKMKLCSGHFERSSFLTTRKNGPLILKANSIPTLFGRNISQRTKYDSKNRSTKMNKPVKKKLSYVDEECNHVVST